MAAVTLGENRQRVVIQICYYDQRGIQICYYDQRVIQICYYDQRVIQICYLLLKSLTIGQQQPLVKKKKIN